MLHRNQGLWMIKRLFKMKRRFFRQERSVFGLMLQRGIFLSVSLEGTDGAKTLAHFESLDEAEDNQRSGDEEKKIQLFVRNFKKRTQERNQSADHGNDK